MAKFMKSKLKVLWGTVFAFFYGFFVNDISAQESDDVSDESVEQVDKSLSPGAIAAAVAAAFLSAGV